MNLTICIRQLLVLSVFFACISLTVRSGGLCAVVILSLSKDYRKGRKVFAKGTKNIYKFELD